MKTIIVTGCVGTGKTTTAKKLAKANHYVYLDLSELIKLEKLHEGYDRSSRSYIVDIKKLNTYLIKLIGFYADAKTKGLVIDSHLSHYLDPGYVNQCIVTKCSLKKLENRLKKRKYGKNKIRENLDAEIFDVCYIEAIEQGHKVKIVTT